MNNRGFTIIELLVAGSMLSLIIAGLTIALIQQQRQFNMTQEAIDIDQTGRTALDFIASTIINGVSRQGKTFSLSFINGGSTGVGGNPPCFGNTANPGSQNSPPDCLTVYSWDISRGQDGSGNFPSTPEKIQNLSFTADSLVLELPPKWFNGNTLIGENSNTDDTFEALLGFRTSTKLCSIEPNVDCLTTPQRCSECAVILKSTIDGAAKLATITGDVDDITGNISRSESDQDALVKQNFRRKNSDFASFTDFIDNAFIGTDSEPGISSQVSEMTIVRSATFRIDTTDRELETRFYGGNSLPIAGGVNAPGMVDLQFVFNLQDPDGGITKVGVPTNAGNRRFSDFAALRAADPNNLLGREKDIRTVEIYLVVRSRIKPQLITGDRIDVRSVPQVGDVLQRNTDHASFGPIINGVPDGVGFVYRVFSTTVYIRNMAREEFG